MSPHAELRPGPPPGAHVRYRGAMSKDDDDKEQEATSEALRALAGQMGAAAGQLIGLQMAVGALIESSPNREALCAQVWAAWERIRANVGDAPSDSHKLVLQSVQSVLQQLGIKAPQPPTDEKQ